MKTQKDLRISTYKDFVGELKAVYKRTEIATIKIKTSNNAISFIRPYFDELMDDREEVKIIHLDYKKCVVNVQHLTSGTDNACLVSTKDILRNALLIKVSGIIMVHNHPSGNLNASKADDRITEKLKKACELLDIEFVDSLIITRESYFSYADSGTL